MSTTKTLQFFLQMNRVQSLLSRRFDGVLGGIGFNEFMILQILHEAPQGKLRRVDLATKMGLTPSGVTRVLLGMEKVGLVKKDVNPSDARVSYVLLSSAGKRRLEETRERAELFVEEIVTQVPSKKIKDFSEFLSIVSSSMTS